MNNDVFEITKVFSSEDTYRYVAEINCSHAVFDGHFPNMPVVPGVCTMNMLKQCLSDALSKEIRYDYIKECKFLSAIMPSKHKFLDVNITIKNEEIGISVIAEVIADEIKMMKLKAILK